MSAPTLSLPYGERAFTLGEVKGSISDRRISMKVKVNAHMQRVFVALTEPEYRELWLRLPGQDQFGRIVALQSKDLFRIDYFQSENLELTIFGSYRRCRQRKVAFDWWKASTSSVSSLVEIRLEGCFDCSILSLSHGGISDEKEYHWQREMWERSLAKLQELFL